MITFLKGEWLLKVNDYLTKNITNDHI